MYYRIVLNQAPGEKQRDNLDLYMNVIIERFESFNPVAYEIILHDHRTLADVIWFLRVIAEFGDFQINTLEYCKWDCELCELERLEEEQGFLR